MGKIYPGYKNNLVNFYHSLLKLTGIENNLLTIKDVDDLFKGKDYKNIIIFMYNGLNNNIVRDSGCSWLYKNKKCDLVADYSSIIANNEFVSKGETMYTKTFNDLIDLLNSINDSTEYKAYGVFPYGDSAYEDIEAAVERVINICTSDDKKILFCYFDELGKLIRSNGCSSKEVFEYCHIIEDQIKRIVKVVDNSLLLITADYGYVDSTNILLSSVSSIMKHIDNYRFINDRFVSINLKRDNAPYFKRLVKKEFADEIITLSKNEMMNSKMFGTNINIMGDVFLSCVKNKSFGINNFGGLSEEEICLPLFVVSTHDCEDIIRVAKKEDFRFVYKAMLDMQSRRERVRKDLFYKRDLFTRDEFFSLCNSTSSDRCFILEKNGELVGFIIVLLKNPTRNVVKNQNYLIVNGIYIKKEYRRQGYGTKLIKKAIDYSNYLHLHKIYVPAWYFEDEVQEFVENIDGLEALKFYELSSK